MSAASAAAEHGPILAIASMPQYSFPSRFVSSRTGALVLLCIAAAVGGCENSFTPKQDYTERLAVFCVLNPSQSAQIVRIESTYDAAGTDPSSPLGRRAIDSAVVRISTDKRSYIFRDTLIDAGGGAQKRVWISTDLVPVEGTQYRLTVQVPGANQVSASVQVPSKPYLVLDPPSIGSGRLGVTLRAGAISTMAPPKGFLFRLFLEGEVFIGGGKSLLRREVPLRIEAATNDTLYPVPGRDALVSFSSDIIASLKSRMEDREGAFNIKVLGFGYSLDTFIYSYFQTVRGFDDPVSVRQDRPDVTNVSGGVGIFGAMVTDSLRTPYVTIVIGK